MLEDLAYDDKAFGRVVASEVVRYHSNVPDVDGRVLDDPSATPNERGHRHRPVLQFVQQACLVSNAKAVEAPTSTKESAARVGCCSRGKAN